MFIPLPDTSQVRFGVSMPGRHAKPALLLHERMLDIGEVEV